MIDIVFNIIDKVMWVFFVILIAGLFNIPYIKKYQLCWLIIWGIPPLLFIIKTILLIYVGSSPEKILAFIIFVPPLVYWWIMDLKKYFKEKKSKQNENII